MGWLLALRRFLTGFDEFEPLLSHCRPSLYLPITMGCR